MGLPSKLMTKDTLGQDQAPFGWMVFVVVAPSLPCLTANTEDGVNTTVFTVRMLE